MDEVRLSVVIPAFNEESNIPELHERLTAVLSSLDGDYELIFVDDGSTDGTLAVIRSLTEQDRAVGYLQLSRNFGHQAALSAGLEHAKGDAVITMDADLQHPPEVIPQLLERWKAGADIVSAIRAKGRESVFKKLTSGVFYRVFNVISDVPMASASPDFRLYDRRVVEIIRTFRERNRFLRGLSAWVGFRQETIRFESGERSHGGSKYPVRRMIRFAKDGLTSFSTLPLRVSTYLGLVVSIVSFLYGAYAIAARFLLAGYVPGWSSIMVAVLFLGGVQLIALGILGEYLGRVYEEVKARPLYLVREKQLPSRVAHEDATEQLPARNAVGDRPGG